MAGEGSGSSPPMMKAPKISSSTKPLSDPTDFGPSTTVNGSSLMLKLERMGVIGLPTSSCFGDRVVPEVAAEDTAAAAAG